MSAFEILHQDDIAGKLTCFDRLIFKGHIQGFYKPGGMKFFLYSQGAELKYWASYVNEASAKIKAHVQAVAAEAGRPYQYLGENHTRPAKGVTKEEMARAIAQRDGITSGLVCVFAALEPCGSFVVVKNAEANLLEVVPRRRKCLHFYLYLIDDELGFCHVRIQSWVPFGIQVWANGHDILARRLDRARIAYLREDNAFYRIANWQKAQGLADKIAAKKWWRVLNHLAAMVNPHLPAIRAAGMSYYWVADQAEISTDVAFRTRPSLEKIMPETFAYASSAFSAEDVLRFLGRKMHPSLAAEVLTDARRRPEGWRIKHRMGRNHLKCYTRGPDLRVETTINDPNAFRVLRVVDGARKWCPMNKGVANLHRYYQVGRLANERYLEALGAAPDHRGGITALERLCRPRTNQGRHHPRLSPLEGRDLAVFRAVMAGQNAIVGFRNHDIAAHLWKRPPTDATEAKRRCAYVCRQLAKLRGHGLIAKVPRHRLYRVTPYGQRAMAAAILIHDCEFPEAFAAA